MSKPLIKDLLNGLGFNEHTVSYQENDDYQAVQIDLPSNQSGLLIGNRGETIDALQTLLNLMLNPTQGDFIPVQVNVNDYRQKRHQALKDLGDRAAQQAAAENQEIILPPLPSHERRLVHLHLESNENVTTYSEGSGRARRLIVRPLDEKDHE